MVKTGKVRSKKRAEKKPVEQQEAPVVDTSAVQPGFWTYVRATLQLVWSWMRSHKLRALVYLLIFGVLVAGTAWLLWPSPAPLTNDQIVTRINRELGISGDGNPAILDVEDASKNPQPFLEEAKNGDKVILYYKAGKSVLYRPGETRIVRQGTFSPPDAKVFIRQGSGDEARPAAVKEQISKLTGIKLVSQDYSINRLNDKTTVVSITDRYPEQVQKIAELLGASVTRLPAGETIPDADILIIVGNN